MTKEEIAIWYENTHQMRERAEAFIPAFDDIYITSVHYCGGIIGMEDIKSKSANPWVSIYWRFNSWDEKEVKDGSYMADELTTVSIDDFVDGWEK